MPALSAINMRLRDDYTRDAAGGVSRWNKVIEKAGIAFEMKLPHTAFHRQIGEFASHEATPEGKIISAEEFAAKRDQWLPSKEDGEFISSLMKPVTEAGQYANWIAAPRIGIDNKPGDFEYVQIHG